MSFKISFDKIIKTGAITRMMSEVIIVAAMLRGKARQVSAWKYELANHDQFRLDVAKAVWLHLTLGER